MDPKAPLEIDHGDDALKRGWEGEIARQARQAKIVREMEWDAAVRRARIIRWTVKVPLAAIILAAAVALGLDYSKVIDLGIFPRHIVEPVEIPSVLADSQQAIAVRNIPNADPNPSPVVVASPVVAPVVATPEPAPVVQKPAPDPEAVGKLQRKVERAHAGVVSLTKSLQERQQQVAAADIALWGTVSSPGRRNHDGLDSQIADLEADEVRYVNECGPRPNQQEQTIMTQTNTTIRNMYTQQGNMQRQMAHDQEVVASLQARLVKAQAEEAAATSELASLLQP